jgi:hypothetical protein
VGNGYLLDQDLKFSKGAIVLVPLVIGKAVNANVLFRVCERFVDAIQLSKKILGTVRVANQCVVPLGRTKDSRFLPTFDPISSMPFNEESPRQRAASRNAETTAVEAA